MYDARYLRQLGLIHQNKAEKLSIAVQCNTIVGKYVLAMLAFSGLGKQRGILLFEAPKSGDHTEDQGHLFFKNQFTSDTPSTELCRDYILNAIDADIPSEIIDFADLDNYKPDLVILTDSLAQYEGSLYALAGRYGLFVGQHPPKNFRQEYNLLTPSLAAAVAAQLVQTILGLYELIRYPRIESAWLSYNVRVGNDAPKDFRAEKRYINHYELFGESCTGQWGAYEQKPWGEGVVCRFVLPAEHPFTKMIQMGKIVFQSESLEFRDGQVSLNIRVLSSMRAEELSRSMPTFIRIGDERIQGHWEDLQSSQQNSMGHRYFQIPPAHTLSNLIIKSIELDSPLAPAHHFKKDLYFSPLSNSVMREGQIYEHDIELPKCLQNKRILLGGIGGLGSWISSLLAVTEAENCQMVMVDYDQKVEEHNLNRQLLYNNDHVASAKASVQATIKLGDIENQQGGYGSDISVPKAVLAQAVLDNIADEAAWKTEGHVKMIGSYIAKSKTPFDMVFSSFDNFQARHQLGLWAYEQGFDLVNGGSSAFDGDVQLLARSLDISIEEYWLKLFNPDRVEKMKGSHENSRPCGVEDRNSDVIGGAIVTAVALVGALQSLLGICQLLKLPNLLHDIKWWGTTDIQGQSLSPQRGLQEIGRNDG